MDEEEESPAKLSSHVSLAEYRFATIYSESLHKPPKFQFKSHKATETTLENRKDGKVSQQKQSSTLFILLVSVVGILKAPLHHLILPLLLLLRSLFKSPAFAALSM